MDKTELIKVFPKQGYSYIIEYKYQNEGVDSIGYYYSDYFEPTEKEIKDYFNIRNVDSFYIVDRRIEVFFYDEYLSDDIVKLLLSERKIECDYEGKKYLKKLLAYIFAINNKNQQDKKESREYAKNVLTSVLKYLDLRKQNPMATYAAVEILNIFCTERDESFNVRKQIELFLDPKENGNVLYQLAKKDYVNIVKHHLDKIGSAYKISEEKSQYRIGILFLRLFVSLNESHFLSPIFCNKDGSIRNYSKYMNLMASYYGITNPPQYREGALKKYKEKGMKSPLYITIKNEHLDVWLSFM